MKPKTALHQVGMRNLQQGLAYMPQNDQQAESRGNRPLVLIVEDNELNLKLFTDLLEAQDYRVVSTRDGTQALDMAREHRPDLILMDIQLPEVSGIDITKWLKADDELKHIPVIAVTAFAMKGDEEKIRASGCEAYMSKPISISDFLQKVAEFVNR